MSTPHISRIAALLRAGGTAVVPAEGVYGLVASASRPDAIARLLQLKGREAHKPMLVLAPGWRAARDLARVIPEALEGLDRQRAAVTVLLPANDGVPHGLAGPEGLVGVRLPADKLGRSLTSEAGLVVSTSANLSGGPTPRTLAEVPPEIRQRVDAEIDGGRLAGVPSTVARWADGGLVIVREGAVDRERLAALVGAGVR